MVPKPGSYTTATYISDTRLAVNKISLAFRDSIYKWCISMYKSHLGHLLWTKDLPDTLEGTKPISIAKATNLSAYIDNSSEGRCVFVCRLVAPTKCGQVFSGR